MRLPVVQLLLFFYFIVLVVMAFKTKRKFVWFLTLFTLVALIFNITLLFTGSSQTIIGREVSRVLMFAFGFPFTFFLLPFALCIEALRTQEKSLIIVAVFSIFVPVLFLAFFSLSDM